ncbi:hypothetical protein HK15_14070 [Acetobacter orientalis]|uniref:Uncharacterized protein n=1 Tax=Acetobacter orientalis TaxID=146474 RepID=A0A252B1J1_9PROT|nr:hypothetical protein HK15_14070 [Acetobacter orientalis]
MDKASSDRKSAAQKRSAWLDDPAIKVNDFQDFPVPEPQYKIPITKSAGESNSVRNAGLQGIKAVIQ